jgi:hypothetical protein
METTSRPSATGSKGAVSRITYSNRVASWVTTARVCCAASSSLGFGGIGPDVITKSPWPTSCNTSSISALPTSTDVSPAPAGNPSVAAMVGRRKSASTRQTLKPASVKVVAKLSDTDVLPSDAIALVTAIVRGGLSTSTNCRFARNRRNASLRRLRLSSRTAIALFAARRSDGIVPRIGEFVACTMSAAVRIRVSSRSRATARPSPTNSPPRSPIVKISFLRGETAAVGVSAG